jgi:predicted lactoylglutathione lyase
MATQIYVNMPVKNLERSMTFFKALGFNFNPQFTNEQGACMVVSENIYVMLLIESFFKTFTPNPICDARKSTEMLVCLSRDSREAVDALVGKAVTAGAATPNKPQDSGFMYGHGFQDLDGHLWEVVYMDMEAFAAQAG